ncbi:unnamed protein product [Parnassius mnemosyne]|uniref:Uncharacterized protein n=1 Tax=Parnassius mnemosyne TaxID=213953 RepID=A0AAV1M4X1_9NEOP
MLSLLLRPLDKMDTASNPAVKSHERLDFSEYNVDNLAVVTQSPLPQEAENIHQDMAEVWEDVFGPPHVTLKPADSEKLTPIAIEVPSSFENSPATSFGDLPSISAPIVPTPVPSPLNSQADCHDCQDSVAFSY